MYWIWHADQPPYSSMIRLNVSAMALSIFVGSEHQHQTIANLGRLVDAGDYYAVRFSASENNIFFARFDDGVRTILRSYDARVRSRTWEKIRLLAGEE